MSAAIRPEVLGAAEGILRLAEALRRAREDLADVRGALVEFGALEGLPEWDRLQRMGALRALHAGARERLRALTEACEMVSRK